MFWQEWDDEMLEWRISDGRRRMNRGESSTSIHGLLTVVGFGVLDLLIINLVSFRVKGHAWWMDWKLRRRFHQVHKVLGLVYLRTVKKKNEGRMEGLLQDDKVGWDDNSRMMWLDGMITPGWDRMLDEIITPVWGRMGWLLQDEEGWMITPGWGGWMGWLLQDEEGWMITPRWGRMR